MRQHIGQCVLRNMNKTKKQGLVNTNLSSKNGINGSSNNQLRYKSISIDMNMKQRNQISKRHFRRVSASISGTSICNAMLSGCNGPEGNIGRGWGYNLTDDDDGG